VRRVSPLPLLDRLWQRGAEEMRLLCFGTRGRPASLLAERVLITPIDR
jgi:hypothetical protein